MSQSGDDLVAFLLRETGETLHVVVQYEADSWQFLYVSDGAEERIARWRPHIAEILRGFRDDATRNRNRERLFDVGDFYCSLHLFDELVVIHFSQADGKGVIFGYDPSAASNLTAFVELCLPHIRRHALEEMSGPPTWSA